MKSILSRVLLLGGFTLVALVLFLPSTPISKKLPSFWVDNIPKIVLGLDLQGGMHLVLDVDRDKAVENFVGRLSDSVEGALKDGGAPFISVRTRGTTITVKYLSPGAVDSIKQIVSENFSNVLTAGVVDDKAVVFTLTEAEATRIRDWATTQVLETIRNRIDKFGVSEPLIQRQGEREIVIQLPGLKDTKRAIDLIGKKAVLEFRLLDDSGADPYEAERIGAPYGTELLYQSETDPSTGIVTQTPYIVKNDIIITGDLISDARMAFDARFNEPYVSISLDSTGARIFERVTGKNVGKRMAIILDGNVYSAPVINERIPSGQVQISGNFSYEEATDLAIILRAGALPAPVEIIQNVTVGPTLGRDSIEAGIKAIVFGGILVLVFMLIYYKASGIIANFAITLNIIMLLGAMAWFNATLTLPGIAGILLTIGMGVDSNVLIFERIKEELKAGRTPRSAVNSGYSRALWTIIDAHVTTLITALVLFQFGSGPIKGFAVSLSLGIMTNLFTALVGTKLAFDVQNDKLKVGRLSI